MSTSNNDLYTIYTSCCGNILKYLERHRDLKLKRDHEWHARLRKYRLMHGDYYAKSPETGEPLINRRGNKILLRCPEYKKAQQLYNWLINNLEQIMSGNFQNVGKALSKRQFIPEGKRTIDMDLIEKQVKVGLDDLRLKLTVMKDQWKEYRTHMEVFNEFLFEVDSKGKILQDPYGNLVPVNIEPMSFDWLDDTKMVLENVNELFVTLHASPAAKEFDADKVVREALGE